MNIKELQTKSQSELQKMLQESREKLRDLRFKEANKQLKDIRSIRRERLLVARLLTLLNKLS